jgi:acyl-CoA hydrolase
MVALVDVSAGFLMREYAPVLERLAIEEEALFIPGVFRGVITNPSLKSDFLHPNAQGYRIVAQRIAHAVRRYVRPLRRADSP